MSREVLKQALYDARAIADQDLSNNFGVEE